MSLGDGPWYSYGPGSFCRCLSSFLQHRKGCSRYPNHVQTPVLYGLQLICKVFRQTTPNWECIFEEWTHLSTIYSGADLCRQIFFLIPTLAQIIQSLAGFLYRLFNMIVPTDRLSCCHIPSNLVPSPNNN